MYNGDIFSVDGFHHIQGVIAGEDPQSPILIDHFMLGRGILTNPFLAEDIKASVIAKHEAIQDNGLDCFVVPPRNDAKRQSEKTDRLHNYVLDLYEDRLRHAGGSPKVLGRMKELWSYLMNSFEEPQVIWRKIKKINALKEYEEAVETIFKEIAIK